MRLTDAQLRVYDDAVLRVAQATRKDWMDQVDNLIAELCRRIADDGTYKVHKILKAGSLQKGTILRPREGLRPDADVAVYLTPGTNPDLSSLHALLKRLVKLVYPTKQDSDFTINSKTLGVSFAASGLSVDLVPVIPTADDDDYGWQPSSVGGEMILTNISAQLAFIRDRKRRDPRYRRIVRLLKRWRDWQELPLRSFPIELLTAHLLDTFGPADSVEAGLLRVLLFIAQTELAEAVTFAEHGALTELPSGVVVVIDPVNAKNNVTARITELERREIVTAAKTAHETLTFARHSTTMGETIDLWREQFGIFRITND